MNNDEHKAQKTNKFTRMFNAVNHLHLLDRIVKIILTIFLVVLCYDLSAQDAIMHETISVKGSVHSDGIPVAYANVYVEDTAYGTVTNEDGDFLLRIPTGQKPKDALVVISSIGFESKKMRLDELIGQERVITIAPATYQLDEVVVQAKKDSAIIILEKAITGIKTNYPRKRHLIEAFYRELSVKDTVYTRLIEAAILVDEPGYKGNTVDSDNLSVEGNRVKIIGIRKSEDNREYDLLGWAFTKAFGEKNDIYGILDDNYVRFIGKKNNHFMSKKFLLEYDVEIIDETSFESKPVVVLRLISKNQDLFFMREILMYIDKADFGILKFEHNLIISPERKEMMQYAIDNKYFYKSIVTYRKTEGVYIPYYIHTKKYASNTNPLKGSTLQYSSIEFLLTNFSYGDYDRIKAKDTMKKGVDVNKSEFEYNEGFWKNYSTVLLNPLSQKARKDLEKKRALDSQFKQN